MKYGLTNIIHNKNKQMKALKLGIEVKDKVSGVKGILTHLFLNTALNKEYIFQPGALSPESGKPVDCIMVDEARIEGGEWEEVDLPLDIIGEKASDKATGFKGTIVSMYYHINGCVHVLIKPKGVNKSTGNTHDAVEFDIRRIKCEKLEELTEAELEKSRKEKPSPSPIPARLLRKK